MIQCKRSERYNYVYVEDNRLKVPFVGIGDLHLGIPGFSRESVQKVIDWVKTNKAYWIGMGDLIESATKLSPGSSVFEQEKNADWQMEEIIKLFKPIADTCIGLLRGNHEHRSQKITGIDPVTWMAKALGVSALGWEGFGCITRPKYISYTFYAVHSYTSNKSAGLALHWNERELMKWVDADIILRAHSHDLGYDPKMTVHVSAREKCAMYRSRATVMTGHFMNRAESYVAQRAAPPKPPGTVALILNMASRPDQRKIEPVYLT